MPAPSGNQVARQGLTARIEALGIALPAPPTPLGVYVEASEVGELLFLSGILPVRNGKLAVSGRLGRDLSLEQAQEAARVASFNALAVARQHLGDLDRLKKLVKLTALLATTEEFVDHASVADGASNCFAQIFGRDPGHVRLVYGVPSLPIAAPLILELVFQIERLRS